MILALETHVCLNPPSLATPSTRIFLKVITSRHKHLVPFHWILVKVLYFCHCQIRSLPKLLHSMAYSHRQIWNLSSYHSLPDPLIQWRFSDAQRNDETGIIFLSVYLCYFSWRTRFFLKWKEKLKMSLPLLVYLIQ